MAFAAGFGKIGGINTAIGVRDDRDIVIAMTVRAGSDLLVSFQEEFFAVHARFISGELVGPHTVKVHRLDVGVALTAFFDDLLFIRNTDVAGGWRLRLFFCRFCRVTAMAAIAKDPLLAVDTSFYLIPLILVAGNAGISFGGL